MKYLFIVGVSSISVFFASCRQEPKGETTGNVKVMPKNTANSKALNARRYTQYEYIDSLGTELTIQNSFPKSGINYTDRRGKKYVYAVFWTTIANNSTEPFELSIDFPTDSFELPALSGNYIKLLLPVDTMTLEKEALFDYGLAVKPFLDRGIGQSSSLKRIIYPKQTSGFYVVILSNRGVNGTLRTELYVKDQNLFYRINGKEIRCGKIKK